MKLLAVFISYLCLWNQIPKFSIVRWKRKYVEIKCFSEKFRKKSFLLHSHFSSKALSKKKNLIGTPNICCKIKPIVWFIWSQENFKLIYVRIKFYCFFFHSILTSYAKSNTRFAMGMTPYCSARYELTFRIWFHFLNY